MAQQFAGMDKWWAGQLWIHFHLYLQPELAWTNDYGKLSKFIFACDLCQDLNARSSTLNNYQRLSNTSVHPFLGKCDVYFQHNPNLGEMFHFPLTKNNFCICIVKTGTSSACEAEFPSSPLPTVKGEISHSAPCSVPLCPYLCVFPHPFPFLSFPAGNWDHLY